MSSVHKKVGAKVHFKGQNEITKADTSHLKPKSRHLETIESERILLIIDEAIKNSNLVASFDTIIDNLEEFSFLLGKQLYCLFLSFTPTYNEYCNVCLKILAAKDELYNVCLETETDDKKDTYDLPDNFWTAPISDLQTAELQAKVSTDIFSENDIEQFKHELPTLEDKRLKLQSVVQYYVRSILIAFRHNPIATKCIMDHKYIWKIKRNLSLTNMIKFLEELREILLQRLLTSPQERDERARFLATVHRKQKQHQAVISELKLTLEKMKIEKEKMICQMNSQIIALQREIYQQEIDGKNEIHRLKVKTDKELEAIKEAHELNKTKLTNDLNEIKGRYNELVEKNRENELTVRRRKWKLETETENWINKYDSEMSEHQMQYDKLKSDYDEEQVSLAELQKRFEPLEKEYLQVLEERRIAKEKEEAERSEHEALVYWATVIQSFWRAWKARKAMRRNRRR